MTERKIGPKEQIAMDTQPFDGLTQHYYELWLRACDDRDRLIKQIESIPEPKPVLPTTPGSVVRHGVLWLLDDDGSWYYKEAMMTRDSMNSGDFEVVFDAGAHDAGKAETDKDADEPYYQAICGSWDCRAPECKPKDI